MSLATLLSQLDTAMGTLSPIPFRMKSQLLTNRERINRGGLFYQVIPIFVRAQEGANSANIDAAQIDILIHYRVLDESDEITFLGTYQETILGAMLATSFWTDMAAVESVLTYPESADPERTGEVVTLAARWVLKLT